jgi:hypothetical protein
MRRELIDHARKRRQRGAILDVAFDGPSPGASGAVGHGQSLRIDRAHPDGAQQVFVYDCTLTIGWETHTWPGGGEISVPPPPEG